MLNSTGHFLLDVSCAYINTDSGMCCSLKPNGNIVNVLHLHIIVNTLCDSLFALNRLWLSFQVSKYLCIFFKGLCTWNHNTLTDLSQVTELFFFWLCLCKQCCSKQYGSFIFVFCNDFFRMYLQRWNRSNKRMHLTFWYIFSHCSPDFYIVLPTLYEYC